MCVRMMCRAVKSIRHRQPVCQSTAGQREALRLPAVMRVLWRVCAWVQYIFDELAVYFGNGESNLIPGTTRNC